MVGAWYFKWPGHGNAHKRAANADPHTPPWKMQFLCKENERDRDGKVGHGFSDFWDEVIQMVGAR